MNLRNLFLINMVISLIFGLALLLGPATLLKIFGMSTGPSENLMAQLLGSALVVPALLSWFAKDFSDPNDRRGAVISLFLYDTIGFIVSLLGVFSRAIDSTGWSVVIIFLLFALGFGYYLFLATSEM